jgi:glycosyltransferase involved in cell wall biosynthesis
VKILHISISNNFVPPEGYGGTERVIHWLIVEQIKRGHEVYCVSPQVKNAIYQNIHIPLWCSEEDAYQISYNAILQIKPDIVHDHTFSQLFRIRHPDIPGVSTYHNERFEHVPNTIYPTFSAAKDNNSKVFVHHGLIIGDYSFEVNKSASLLYLGAIHPRKNVDLAIRVAKKKDIDLMISGPVRHPRYFSKKIRKHLFGKINYVGESFGEIKHHLLRNAKGFIYPSAWESFGLAIIESMVSGTPVIVSDIQPFSEIVIHGETGFICKNIKDYICAIESLDEIDPNVCREHVIKNFNSTKMSDEYIKLYHKVKQGESW